MNYYPVLYPVKKNLVHGKSSLWGAQEMSGSLEGLALSSEPRCASQDDVSALQHPMVPGNVSRKLVSSLVFGVGGVLCCEALEGLLMQDVRVLRKEKADDQCPGSQLPEKTNQRPLLC